MIGAAKLRKVQGERLRSARKAAGYRSARAAALENEWPESSYRAHEAGTRTIGQDDADRYAKRFRALGVKVTGQTILYGDSAAPEPDPQALALNEKQATVVRLVFQAFLEYGLSDPVLRERLKERAYQAAFARIASEYARSQKVQEAAQDDDESALKAVRLAVAMKLSQ